MTIITFLEFVGGLIVTSTVVYLLARLASAAHYRSKREFLESLGLVKNTEQEERRKTERRQSEYIR